jgi:hypothetical protein
MSHFVISSLLIFNFDKRMVQFCALRLSITVMILVLFPRVPIWRRSSIDPSSCKK